MVARKPFVYQERTVWGWCGPAALAIALAALDFPVTQEVLAQIAPYDPDWGTDHLAMLNGARHFVPESYELVGSSLENLAEIAKRDVVILNFMDTEIGMEPPQYGAGNGEDGHYVLLDSLSGNDMVVVDSNPISVEGGFRKLSREWFERHFWDICRGNEVMERWALVIPAASV